MISVNCKLSLTDIKKITKLVLKDHKNEVIDSHQLSRIMAEYGIALDHHWWFGVLLELENDIVSSLGSGKDGLSKFTVKAE
jgi:spore cortex formation protein SpoVR/YcgB (stage V sporulation)